MRKKELAKLVIERLKEEYPESHCSLDYDDAWKLLVSVRLAAQCTDARVNVVVQDLFAAYPSVEALAEATPEEIEKYVHPCGLGKSKARDISACMKMLRDQYDCHVPDDFDAFLARRGAKKCQPHHGGCLWQAGDRDGYPLYPALQPDRTGGRHQGSEKSGDGTLEDRATGGGQ